MKLLQFLILIFFFSRGYGQQDENNRNSVSIYFGAKTRITPIYLKQVPSVINIGYISDLEQPNKHLSGPGLQISEKKYIKTKYIFSFHQIIRHDYVYQELPLVAFPPPDFKYEIKRKLIFDIYIDISRIFYLRNSTLNLSAGTGICGLNSGYVQTKRIYQTSTDYIEYEKKKNFIFPTITTGLGWYKNKFLTELKFGYCWNDPTLYNTPFIYPEISLQYQIFHREKD